MRSIRAATLLIAGLCAVAAPTVAAGARAAATPVGPARTFAVIPYYSPEKLWQLFTPFVEYLRQETGEAWELKLYPGHAEMIAGVCAGQVDVALLGPVPLGEVNKVCGAMPFLVPLGKDGKPLYHSMLLAGDPAVMTAAGLRGKKVGFFRGSTAAHILPMKMLADAGLEPGTYEPVFLASQDKLMTGLLKGSIAGAGVKETLYRRFKREQLRLLLTSEPLPNFAFAALPSQPPAFRARFVAALLKLRPLASATDARRVRGWDDEIKHGFMLPAADFLPAVLRLHELSRALAHENR